MEKFLSIVGLVLLAMYVYTRYTYSTPPLTQYYQEDELLGQIQNLTNASANLSSIPVAQIGEGWATALQNVPSNMNRWTRSPQATRLNFRFTQPSN